MSTQSPSNLMELASMLVKAGSLPQAKSMYEQICQSDKDNAEAWTMLGAVNAELGSFAEAASCQRQAIKLQPRSAIPHLHLANACLHLGRPEEARTSCQTALDLQPGQAAAWYMLAKAHMPLKEYGEAEAACRKAIDLGANNADVYFILGKALHAQKKLDECIESYREALQRNPRQARAYYRLGMALYDRGELDEAAASYNDALRINPNQPAVHYNLGIIHQEQKRLDAAEASYREALRLKPDYAKAQANLGYVLYQGRKIAEAATCYRQALRLDPASPAIHLNLAMALHDLGQLEDAVKSFQAAVQIKPDYAEALHHLGTALADLGRTEEAAASYRKALDISDNAAVRMKLASLLPVIAESNAQIDEARRRFGENISALLEQDLVIGDPLKEINQTNFYLVYHGQNDRILQEKTARLLEKSCPALLYEAPHCRHAAKREARAKISVGFISSYFYNHTIGNVMKGMISRLSRDLFTVTVFTTPQKEDDVRQYIRQHSDRWIELPNDLSAARALVAEQELDVLLYTDIGMEPFTYFLAFSRLAPVQCVTWGHPVTTGIGNLDYYISCEDFEPEEAQAHYSETLVRLRSVPTYYYRPGFPPAVTRAHFGLGEDRHLYLCQQTLFKFHPDFDEFLAGVLRADPRGTVVLISTSHRDWMERLQSRFQKTMPDVADRIRVLPYQSLNNYLNLLTLADAILDTLPFGGGSSVYQALAVGTPIVTLPGKYMRGRFAYACYRKMGITDCVATDREDYVRIAVRLGTDSAYRDEVRKKILAANHALYEDQGVIRELEEFLTKVVREKGPIKQPD